MTSARGPFDYDEPEYGDVFKAPYATVESAPPVTQAPKKRRNSTSPTARTLAECRKRGWVAQNVEQFVRFPPPGHRLDLFGVIDIIAVVPIAAVAAACLKRTIGIQATASAAHHAHRRDKILAEPRAREWVDAGNGLELWSWSKRGTKGKRKLWTLRVETYAEMQAGLAP